MRKHAEMFRVDKGYKLSIYILRLILVAYNFCFSAKLKSKKGRKEKVEKRSFVLYQHSSMMYLSSKI